MNQTVISQTSVKTFYSPRGAETMWLELVGKMLISWFLFPPVDRESKVLSGRSLMTLSRVVPEGLTLAVYLDVPDTVITGE